MELIKNNKEPRFTRVFMHPLLLISVCTLCLGFITGFKGVFFYCIVALFVITLIAYLVKSFNEKNKRETSFFTSALLIFFACAIFLVIVFDFEGVLFYIFIALYAIALIAILKMYLDNKKKKKEESITE